MASDLRPEPEVLNRIASDRSTSQKEKSRSPGRDSVKLEHLSALFIAHGGGRFSEQVSTNLALEIVLNEIVEQACLTTGAEGATIALLRDEEMVCRASSGALAPPLGTRLDRESGISGECIRSRRVQRCDDVTDDSEAGLPGSMKAEVHSVMLLPLMLNESVLGVFEILSARSSAFGERDQRTLEALALGVVKNLERVQNPRSLSDFQAVVDKTPEDRGIDFVTWALGLMVLACALFLGVRSAERAGWIPENRKAGRNISEGSGEHRPQNAPAPGLNEPGVSGSKPAVALNPVAGSTPQAAPAPDPKKLPSQKQSVSDGALRVYQSGVEVFHVNGSEEKSAEKAGGPEAQASSSNQTIQLPPAALQDNLLYRVEPEYPEVAREKQIESVVVLRIHISREGTVQDEQMVSGNPILGRAGVEAVKQWRFKPQRINGHLTEAETMITLFFRMRH